MNQYRLFQSTAVLICKTVYDPTHAPQCGPLHSTHAIITNTRMQIHKLPPISSAHMFTAAKR